MAWRNTSERWGALARLFHWAIVLMLLGQFIMAELAEDLPLGMEKIALLARHKSVGITILLLAVLRLGWRALNPTPRAPAGAPWEHALARGAHVALYGLLFAMPLSGWMMSSAKNYPVSWFNLLPLPNLVPVSESIYEFMHETHELLATALLVIAATHVLGALRHHFIRKDDVLKRMLWAAAGASLLLGTSTPATHAAASATSAAPSSAANPAGATQAWRLQPAGSTLNFVFEQAGAATEGRFGKFNATLLQPLAPTVRGTLAVTIDIASLSTGDAQRDTLLREADLFNAAKHPQAQFKVASLAQASQGRVKLDGVLTLRGVSKRLSIPATLQPTATARPRTLILQGETTLNRLDFGIGQGEWKSTEWVANAVKVRFTLRFVAPE
jgi:cytochrome b561/polyisoprenoid-binding protein YceI